MKITYDIYSFYGGIGRDEVYGDPVRRQTVSSECPIGKQVIAALMDYGFIEDGRIIGAMGIKIISVEK